MNDLSTISGSQWEQHAKRLLGIKYGIDNIQPISSETHGDGGVDILIRSQATVYQCYAAEHSISAKDLLTKQQNKITEDIGKFITNINTISKFFIGSSTKIRRWILFVPFYKDKKLVAHATEKAAEVMRAIPGEVSEDFEILVNQLSDFSEENNQITEEPVLPVATPWGTALWNNTLWPEHPVSRLQRQVSQFGEYCYHILTTSTFAPATPNPWRDNEWPIRAIERVERLSKQTGRSWCDAEVALLLLAPVLRHTALALAESAAWVKIAHLTTDTADGLQEPAERAFGKQLARKPQLQRKLQRLSESNHTREADWLRHWLLHQSLLRESPLWDLNSPLLPLEWQEHVWNLLEQIDPKKILFSRQDKSSPFRLARSLSFTESNLEAETAENSGIRLDEGNTVNLTDLGHLLALAGWLALDPLLLPEVIADHLGLREPIEPQSVVDELRRLQWVDGASWDMQLRNCPHPALDSALRDVVAILEALRRKIGWENLPSFGAARLLAKKRDGQPTYQTPHLRFTLAQDEVRELLMGEQLYGDPSLAIRELYQNALDACRYTEVRLLARLYQRDDLKRQGWSATAEGRRPGNGAGLIDAGEMPTAEEKAAIRERFGWEGKIIFREGTDNRGPYIECEDNGIGMGLTELRTCFAKAGRRFTETEEYIDEAETWKTLGIGHYPNSQFGIGVFSYFMLAEEIDILTCRMPQKLGGSIQPIDVTISGSGSLFRVYHSDQAIDNPHGYGTRIRLWLNRTTMKEYSWSTRQIQISAASTLKIWLWISDFHVFVKNVEDKVLFSWNPGELREDIIKKHHPTNLPDLWWSRSGRFLSDGIRTDSLHPCLVINLRGKQYPRLTTDRKQVTNPDTNWILNNININGWKTLPLWTDNSLKFYQEAASLFPLAFDRWWKFIQLNNASFSIDLPEELIIKGRDDPYHIRHGIFPINTEDNFIAENKKKIMRKLKKAPNPEWHFQYIMHSVNIKSAPIQYATPRLRTYSIVPPIIGYIFINNLHDSIFERSREISTHCLIRLSFSLNINFKDLYSYINSYRIYGYLFPEHSQDSLKDIPMPDESDITLLSKDLDGSAPWIEDGISLPHLVLGSEKLRLPLKEVWQRLKKYEPLGIQVADLPEEEAS
ncbi:MAG: hypothetical protein HQL56_13095 [Magnetococcales bacterium]|nr:hypothetical protein [Magnetococcales bacterium]